MTDGVRTYRGTGGSGTDHRAPDAGEGAEWIVTVATGGHIGARHARSALRIHGWRLTVTGQSATGHPRGGFIAPTGRAAAARWRAQAASTSQTAM